MKDDRGKGGWKERKEEKRGGEERGLRKEWEKE